MAAAAGGDLRAGIGSRLRAAREKKSLTILQAAEKMHVDARILESLESEDFVALGAPVYARGHLRHYAELVGESPKELQQLYADSAQGTPAQPDLRRIARVEPEGDSGKLVGPGVVGLVAVGIVGVVWWLLTLSGENVQSNVAHSKLTGNTGSSQPAQVPPDTEADNEAPAPMPAPEQESAPPNAKAAVGARATAGSARAGSATAGSNTTAVAPGAKSTGAAKSVPPAAASRLAAATNGAQSAPGKVTPATTAGAPVAVANVTAPPPTTRSKEGELTLRFSSDSWAEVYDASGQRLFYDVGAASSTHIMKGPAPLRVILGNPSGVSVEFNGRSASIPAGVGPDGRTRFTINAHGRTVPASPGSGGD